jgi:Uncharacterized conserved protein (COG2071)
MITASIACSIERRLLVNYRIDPDLVYPHLPAGFTPQLVSGWAVAGVCFTRLAHTRPSGLPPHIGIRSENVAHRFAVEWEDGQGTRAGVYIPRRDTNSRAVTIAGGPVFPGVHHPARFVVSESPDQVAIAVASRDQEVRLEVTACPVGQLTSELFSSVEDAMNFFRHGSTGWSPSPGGNLDQVRLDCDRWSARPAQVTRMVSSLFDGPTIFTPKDCTLDSALLMENLKATWTGSPNVRPLASPTEGGLLEPNRFDT